MITGVQLSPELLTNKDTAVYRKYLIEKSQESTTPYTSLILPTIAAAAFGGYAAHKAKQNKAIWALIGSSIPIAGGSALKFYDDRQILIANKYKAASKKELANQLDKTVKEFNENPDEYKIHRVLNLFSKTAAMKPINKAILKGTSLLGLIGAVGVYASKKLDPKKWALKTPIQKLRERPIISIPFKPHEM